MFWGGSFQEGILSVINSKVIFCLLTKFKKTQRAVEILIRSPVLLQVMMIDYFGKFSDVKHSD